MKAKRITVVLIISLFSTLAIGQINNDNSNPISKNATTFDFSSLPWTEAFDSLHTCMSLRYPYTEWKAVDWPEKETITRPHIVDAQNSSDTIAFIKFLFKYLYSVPDGHIMLNGVPSFYKKDVLGGSYGFNMCPLEDGTIAVSAIDPESQAWQDGLRTGNKIVKWNNILIDSINAIECFNFIRNYATVEGRLFSRYLILSRDSIGAEATVTFENASKQTNTINISSYDDGFAMLLEGFYNTADVYNPDSIVTYRLLENNIGYLKIVAETAEGETPEEIKSHPDFIKVSEAVEFFNQNLVDKLIVDLRFNLGGNDLQAAVTMGMYYENQSFYEYVTGSYDNNYEILFTLYTEPLQPLFTGEIAVIVDPNCISTGEGFAMMFQRLENAKIVSHWGTNGSFGMVNGDPVLLPLEISLVFPQARSLDENYIIQLDSDSTMSGGVSPDIKVPLTVENIIAQWNDGKDVQLEYAVSYLLDVDEIIIDNKCLLFPNPCNDFIKLKINCETTDILDFTLINILGKKVYHQQLNCINSNQIFTLNTNKINTGVYFYNISNGIKEYQGKIIVKH
ncbi:MAG: T9SS type A sorting domain-containing protein [Bacteroidales bacterium]|nr:T9SS type A sorting domain-containing protein [Bacteroidales bacterium]